MKKLLLFLTLTLLLLTSCKEEYIAVLHNQEVEVVFVGYKEKDFIQIEGVLYPQISYEILVKYKGKEIDISDEYFRPKELSCEVGDIYRATVIIYPNEKYELRDIDMKYK